MIWGSQSLELAHSVFHVRVLAQLSRYLISVYIGKPLSSSTVSLACPSVQFYKSLNHAQADAQATLRAINRSISLREEIEGLTSWPRSNGIDSNDGLLSG